MSLPRPNAVVERLEIVIQLDSPPRRLKEVIEAELNSHFQTPALQAAEHAERVEARVAHLITERQMEVDRVGVIAKLSLTGTDLNMVLGACYVLPTDLPYVARIKQHRFHADPLLQRIRTLTPKEFEIFGAKVLYELGAQKVYVTPQSNDQGIDFYGALNIGQLIAAPTPFFRLAHDLEVKFAGQAKNYPINPIGTNVVRELVGAIALARFKTFSTDEDLFETLQLKPMNPLIAILFTTGRLTSGAIDLADKLGVIARSGEQLAAFLADRGIGMIPDGGSTSFDVFAFNTWLLEPYSSDASAEVEGRT